MDLKCFRYRLPFVQPFKTSHRSIAVREGIILQLQKKGITAYGEAAPLPGFSSESLNQVLTQLQKLYPRIHQLFSGGLLRNSLDVFYNAYDVLPSLCFALDTLACNYEAQTNDRTASQLLFTHPASSIAVNAVIPMHSPSKTLSEVEQYCQQGFQTFKVKLGNDFASELAVLNTIRRRYPDVALRVDANRAWRPDEASVNLNRLAELDIEYCEEPLAEPTLPLLEQLSAGSPVPIALDETLTEIENIASVAPVVSILILKPMLIGQFSKLFATKHLADTHDNKVVFTTSLESGVGRLMTAILASGLGSQHLAQGLATGNLLATDVWHDRNHINNGYFTLPDRSEQGEKHRPDLQNLAEEIHLKRD